VEVLEIFGIRADEHVAHEEGVVGSGANHPNLDAVLLVPSRKPVDHVDSVSGVEIINSTLTIDSPDLAQQIVSIAMVSNSPEKEVHVLGR
jgi:hypothetical protein